MKPYFGLLLFFLCCASFAEAQLSNKLEVLELKSAPKEVQEGTILLPRWRERTAESGESYFSYGGEARFEYDRYQNAIWGDVPNDNDGFSLLRLMAHADYRWNKNLRGFLDIISASILGNENPADPPDRDDLDVHQAFLDVTSGAVTARLGRQEMEYGSGKFVSLREGKNVRASFDGLRVISELPNSRLSLFLTQPTSVKAYGFDDEAHQKIDFWGAFWELPESVKRNFDLYYFGIRRDNAQYDIGVADETRHTFGLRYGDQIDEFEYETETAAQFGKFGDRDIQAWTVAFQGGVRYPSIYDSRLSLTTAVASGDKDPNDGKLETFYAMFPKGAFFGQIAQNGPSNFISLRPSFEINPNDRLSLVFDYYWFWRESTKDGLYGIPGDLLRSGKQSEARFIGSQPGFEATYAIAPGISASAYYAHFFAGEFLKETPPGEDIDFVGARILYRF